MCLNCRPRPLPTSDLHVVVPTIQTLNAKLKNQPGEHEFLTDFKLVVFDEAHRSVAPTFTSVMQEIGTCRSKLAHSHLRDIGRARKDGGGAPECERHQVEGRERNDGDFDTPKGGRGVSAR